MKCGPTHIFNVIPTARQLPENLRQITDPCDSEELFFSHPENMKLAMAVDMRVHVKVLSKLKVKL